jgi:hypothetical protein
MLAGRAIYKREMAQLFKELETRLKSQFM